LPQWEKFKPLVKKYLDVSETAPENKKLYRVQVGAFNVRSNAEKLCADLRQMGYSDAFVKSE
jgi:N-acetylmuramoyl-L-alanine amidase